MKIKIFIPLVLFFTSCSESHVEIPESKTDFCASIHRNDSLSLNGELAGLKDSLEKKTGVFVLEDGSSSMVARAWLTEYAEKTIDIQYFIFSTDNVGLIACDYLVRAADRGVKVRMLVDDIVVDAGPHEILTMDSHENIEIKIYNPGVNLGKNLVQKIGKFATDFKGANQRMHNKTFNADNKVVITGGRNIADEYFDYDHEYNFRDRDLLMLGKEIKAVSSSFEQFWASPLSVPVTQLVEDPEIDKNAPNRFERLHRYACNPKNFWPQVRERMTMLPQAFRNIVATGQLKWLDSVQFIADVPGKVTDGSRELSNTATTLFDLVRNAKCTIDIQSPYLVTTDKGKALFKAAVERGVKVRVLTNSLASTDNLEAFSGYKRDRKELLQTGIRIFEFRPDAKEQFNIMTGALEDSSGFKPVFGLHAKTMVVDGHITVIGTFNLDPRSAYRNSECITVVHSKDIARSVLRGMEDEFNPENSWETTLQFNPDEFAGTAKRAKVLSRRVVPKGIL